MYIHSEFYLITEKRISNVDLKYRLVILSPAENKNIRLVLLSIYNNPKTNTTKFICEMERLVSALPDRIPALITGDFNIDILKKNSTTKILHQLMKYYEFEQTIQYPTHRRGGLLDHFYTNIRSDHTVCTTVPTYYSDHLMLSIAIPKWSFQ